LNNEENDLHTINLNKEKEINRIEELIVKNEKIIKDDKNIDLLEENIRNLSSNFSKKIFIFLSIYLYYPNNINII
jgi:hypothetical protein